MSKIKFLIEDKFKPYGIIIADDKFKESVFLKHSDIKRLKKVLKDFEKKVKP